MRSLMPACCLVAAALLTLDSAALAQRGQGSGQGQAPPKPPASSPAKPPASSPAKPSSGTAGSKGEAARVERNESKERGATEALRRNQRLAESMKDLLPGQNLETASSGFRNLGQFVAAAQVSKNTGIPFNELKTRMVDREMSLGQAIKDARPELDAPAEARKAEAASRERMAKAERDR